MDARQLARVLTQSIEDGGLSPGARLPSQSALMKEHGVSRHVVRKALGLLEERHLITSWQGRWSGCRPDLTASQCANVVVFTATE